ncbi:hypothetical protein [Methylobacterium sp. 1030]|uniref:hypothetical protein n=1 Tax=Methylobacterium sp. 1030 TaxID=3156404 RepID=UPI003398C8AC
MESFTLGLGAGRPDEPPRCMIGNDRLEAIYMDVQMGRLPRDHPFEQCFWHINAHPSEVRSWLAERGIQSRKIGRKACTFDLDDHMWIEFKLRWL